MVPPPVRSPRNSTRDFDAPRGTSFLQRPASRVTTAGPTPAGPASTGPLPAQFHGNTTVEQESRGEVGCLLGSFHDVAHAIGFNVTAVHLEARLNDQPVWTSLPLPERPQPLPATHFDASTPRNLIQFNALLNVFCDSMLTAGFVVRHIDVVKCPPATRGTSKKWKMEVCINHGS